MIKKCGLVALLAACVSPLLEAATETLESQTLRIELNTSPYSYRVIERSTGAVLLSESNTIFKFGKELYPATDATDVTKTADGMQATLLLQTAGRDELPKGTPDRAQVLFTFTKPEIVQVVLKYENGTPGEISEEFNDQGEHYYGIWEYPAGGNIDNRGADRDFLGMRNSRYVHHSSARAPFYMTSNKYAIYVESLADGHFVIAEAGKTSFSFREPQLKYDIMYGPAYADMLARYNAMAGPAFMPPLWAFGSIWWRDDAHEDLRDAANAQEKVVQDADRLRALRIPASAMWLDRPYASGDQGWGNMDLDSSFPDPPRMIRDLKERGINLMVWIANRSSGRLYEEGKAKGYLFPGNWPAAEIERPEVYSWFKEKLSAYVRLGIKGYKIDRGDEDEMPRAVENQNAVLFPKLAAEGQSEINGNDYFIFSRNANDTARKYTSIWSGDPWNNFAGLEMAVKNAQRSGAINFPMWGSDTGAYFSVPTKELFARWFEFSAYSPMMEVLIGPKRTVWYDYDQGLIDIAKTYAATHHDLIPYTRSYVYAATQTGMPVMRSLILEYPADKNLSDTWDEYLYGHDLLVAPVTVEGASERKVYLPAGRWINYNHRTTAYEGPTTISAEAPLGTIPVFVREGAIIPRGDILKGNNNWEENWAPNLHIEFFPSNQFTSEFDYYTGSGVKKITAAPRDGNLEIDFGDLETNGTLEVYCNNVKGLSSHGAALARGSGYTYDARAHKLTIPFHGAGAFVIEGATSIFGQ
jgi:alpha-glucosidase (family GH31 glycosyl hydrolase)